MLNIIEQHEIVNKIVKYVACYIRVSTEEQVKYGFSIQAQKDALEKYCKEHGYKYVFFIDEGISASSMKKRKALNDMLSKVSLFDMILFTKLDRLSRNVLDANIINQILQQNNCTMKAIDEDDVDTSTADGLFIFNLKVSLAQREIGKTSERINFVFKNKREKGEVTSGTKKYGYDIINRKYVINEIEAENIRNLYKYYISVNGNFKKAYSYFIEHFKNKGRDALYLYLKDTAYVGKYKLYRKNVYLDNYIPAIVDTETFNTVQNLLKRKENSSHKSDTPPATALFSGLLYCNKCNSKMLKKQDTRAKYRLMRYFCDKVFRYELGTTKRKCDNKQLIREEEIEQFLFDNLDAEFNKFKANCTTEEIQIKSENPQKIKSIEKKLEKLKDLYIDDLIDKETYTQDYKRYMNELSKLKTEIIVQKPRDLSHIEKILNSNYVNVYNNLSLENKRRFWLSFIDKIYIEDRKIKRVTFL